MHVFFKAIRHRALVYSIVLRIRSQVQEHTENQVIRTSFNASLIGYHEFLGIELRIIPYKLFSKSVDSSSACLPLDYEMSKPNALHQVKIKTK